MKTKLVLEDGSSFEGASIGVSGEKTGEVVLNTAVVGYQEMITDPANAGKILILTYPLIGNYGVARKFYESKKCWINGLVIKESSAIHSNWQAEDTFENFLNKEKVIAASKVDTRTLAVRIRDNGEMYGIITTSKEKESKLIEKIVAYKKRAKKDFVKNISVKKVTKINGKSSGPNIAIIDIGISNSFIAQLKNLGCSITLLPYNTEADRIIGLKPDGLIISNGPEGDISIPVIIETVKKLLGKIPMLGISTGHEIIGLALGGKLKKMEVGHHGVNYPVKAPSSFKGDITVQNHSFVVDEESIKNKDNIKVTLVNVNDNTIEEMEGRSLKFISTQYYPVSSGPGGVLKRFLNIVKC